MSYGFSKIVHNHSKDDSSYFFADPLSRFLHPGSFIRQRARPRQPGQVQGEEPGRLLAAVRELRELLHSQHLPETQKCFQSANRLGARCNRHPDSQRVG